MKTERIIIASQTVTLAISDMREALKNASAVESILILSVIERLAIALNDIDRLAVALKEDKK